MRAIVVGLALLLAVQVGVAAEPAQDDCGSGADAPYSPGEGAILALPVACDGVITMEDERDSYRFEAPPGVRVHVEATRDDPSDSAIVFLFTPDHGEGRPPQYADFGVGEVSFVSHEPGLWSFFLYLCDGADCHAGTGSYHLRIWTEGAPWTPMGANGTLLLGAPARPKLNEALGPQAPAPTLDARYVPLPRATTGIEFARLDLTDCDACLSLGFADASGETVSGSGACGRVAARLECGVPPGAVYALVMDDGGLDAGWALTYWAPDA